MKRDVDRAIALGSVAVVAIVPAILLGAVPASGGFNGGHTGGTMIPSAGEAPAPATTQTATPSPAATAAQAGAAAAPPGGAAAPTPAVDTGSANSFTRLMSSVDYKSDGTMVASNETAQVVMKPFALSSVVVTKTTGVGGKVTVQTVKTTVKDGKETIQTNKKKPEHFKLTSADKQYFTQFYDPVRLAKKAEAHPLEKRKAGAMLFGKKIPAGKLKIHTYTLQLTLGALVNYVKIPGVSVPSGQLSASPWNEGLTGTLVADKYNRAHAFDVAKILLPWGVDAVSILYFYP